MNTLVYARRNPLGPYSKVYPRLYRDATTKRYRQRSIEHATRNVADPYLVLPRSVILPCVAEWEYL